MRDCRIRIAEYGLRAASSGREAASQASDSSRITDCELRALGAELGEILPVEKRGEERGVNLQDSECRIRPLRLQNNLVRCHPSVSDPLETSRESLVGAPNLACLGPSGPGSERADTAPPDLT